MRSNLINTERQATSCPSVDVLGVTYDISMAGEKYLSSLDKAQ